MDQRPCQGPLFIVGLPRSGTKLLRAILNNHPRVYIPDIETGCLPLWVSEWEKYGDLSKYESFLDFYKRSIRLPYFQYQIDRDSLIGPEQWFESCRDFTVAGVFEALVRNDTGTLHTDGVIWGDKSPSYVKYILMIASLFPSARIVHIVRDVRDYCLSMESAWGKNKIRAAQRWADTIENARRDAAALSDQYMEVRYEDLLSDPAFEMSKVCDFIGVSFHDSMLILKSPSENIGETVGKAFIVRGNTGKYVERMTQRDLSAIEAIAGHVLRDMGYDVQSTVSKRRVSKGKMVALQALDGLHLMLFNLRRRSRISFGIRYWLSAIHLKIRMRGGGVWRK